MYGPRDPRWGIRGRSPLVTKKAKYFFHPSLSATKLLQSSSVHVTGGMHACFALNFLSTVCNYLYSVGLSHPFTSESCCNCLFFFHLIALSHFFIRRRLYLLSTTKIVFVPTFQKRKDGVVIHRPDTKHKYKCIPRSSAHKRTHLEQKTLPLLSIENNQHCWPFLSFLRANHVNVSRLKLLRK